jgi:hypothetical protein
MHAKEQRSMTGKEAMLLAFDRLFDRAAAKLHVDCKEEDKAEAKQHFAERFSALLDLAAQVTVPAIPDEVVRSLEEAIDDLSPAQIVEHLATIPLVSQAQQVLRTIAYRDAEQRVLEHLISQADTTYGGN